MDADDLTQNDMESDDISENLDVAEIDIDENYDDFEKTPNHLGPDASEDEDIDRELQGQIKFL